MRFLALLLFLSWTTHGQSTTAAKKTPAAKRATQSSTKTTAKSAATSSAESSTKSTVKSTAGSATGSKAGAAKSGAAKSNTKSKRTVVARRPLQQQPSADRYREIQQALASKGYFAGPVDGNWGPESVDALKRFQKAQNLDTDGKLGALSLIALGLGPKHGASAPGNLVAPGAKAETADPPAVDPPPVARPDTPEAPAAAQPDK